MDAITDFLSAIRVQGVCYGRKQVTGSWVPRSDGGSHAGFGLISCGEAWMDLPGERIHLSRGDFFLLAPGREYVMSTGAGAPTAIIAGRFSFDGTHSKSLFGILPPIIVIRDGQPHMLPLKKTLELLASEVEGSTPGAELAVRRLADLLLIQALRAHIADTHSEQTGWLHAAGDSQIGAALDSMHKRIEHPWTVASLASEAGMSRSAFAQRFKKLMNESPLEYLTRWRMYRGSDLLRESDRKLADVAQAVGYARMARSTRRLRGSWGSRRENTGGRWEQPSVGQDCILHAGLEPAPGADLKSARRLKTCPTLGRDILKSRMHR